MAQHELSCTTVVTTDDRRSIEARLPPEPDVACIRRCPSLRHPRPGRDDAGRMGAVRMGVPATLVASRPALVGLAFLASSPVAAGQPPSIRRRHTPPQRATLWRRQLRCPTRCVSNLLHRRWFSSSPQLWPSFWVKLLLPATLSAQALV